MLGAHAGSMKGVLVDRSTRRSLSSLDLHVHSAFKSAIRLEEGSAHMPLGSPHHGHHDGHKSLNMALLPEDNSEPSSSSPTRASWGATVATLLSLQLGWGLWLMPHDFARLGWLPAGLSIFVLTFLSMYSGALISRLCRAAGGAMLFGDIGESAAGNKGRYFVYGVVCTMDATRCIIVHLAATQSLQHTVCNDRISLYYYGAVIAVVAVILVQIKSLSEMGWFLSAGTVAQLCALAILIFKVLAEPHPQAKTVLVNSSDWPAAMVAVMNIVYAFSGQSAYVEIIAEMRAPHRFPSALSAATVVMTLAYLGIGVAGYSSQGDSVDGIIIFDMGDDFWSRVASGAVLIQAVAQYLVALNIWSHNILLLVARRRAAKAGVPCQVHYAVDHDWLVWLCTSTLVISYAYAISVTIPFFSTLVGLIASATYLTTAYTIPCLFTLLQLGKRIPRIEYLACALIIPLSVAASAAGLYSSVLALLEDLGGPGLLPGVADITAPFF